MKGMFVHPRQIAAALTAYPEVVKWQGSVTAEGHQDLLTLRVAAEEGAGLDADAVKHSVEEAVKMRLEVEVVDLGAVGEHDGQVVDERIRPL